MFFSLQLPEIIALLIGENMLYFAKMFFYYIFRESLKSENGREKNHSHLRKLTVTRASTKFSSSFTGIYS